MKSLLIALVLVIGVTAVAAMKSLLIALVLVFGVAAVASAVLPSVALGCDDLGCM